MPSEYDRLAGEIAILVTELYLNITYIAHIELKKSLIDVITKNMSKISARIKEGRVDKSDGERGASLL